MPKYSWAFRILLLSTLALAIQAASGDPLPRAIAEPLTRDLETLRQQLSLPGMSVALLVDQQIAFAEGFGLADLEQEVPASTTTPYHICSLTKPISATLIMALVEEGRLDLDASMREICAEAVFQVNGERILGYDALCTTLVGLINHPCTEHDFKLRHHLSHTARGVPGERYRYSGWLFGLLTQVLEEATDQDFAGLLATRIGIRLGLESTYPTSSPEQSADILDRRALPYRIREKGGFDRWSFPTGLRTSAGMVSTVLDLARFDIAIDRHELISKESTREMWQAARLNDGTFAPYGLGWFVQEIEGGERAIWHYGWQPDRYSSLYIKFPDRNLTFIMLANSDGASSGFELGRGDLRNSPFLPLLLDLLGKLPLDE